MTITFQRSHFERNGILLGVRKYVAYPISYLVELG
jgi:transposase-like protein